MERSLFFTSDTGVEALEKAIVYCVSLNISLTDLTWMQVPHLEVKC